MGRGVRAWRGSLAAALCAVALSIAAPPLAAHGELHNQIAEMDRQIAAQPDNTALLLRRAELHRIHREWALADQDYARVEALQPKHPEVQWLRARATLEAGKPQLALPELDRYLALYPDHATARLTRARALVALGRHPQAAADYALALERMPQPNPDHYLELVKAQRDSGMSPAVQLASIEKGINRLGFVPSLEDVALDIEMRAKRWDAALFRIDRQISVAARKERLLYRRGQVLAQAGRRDEAIAAFRASMHEIEKLPEALRTPRATAQLIEQVQLELRRSGSE